MDRAFRDQINRVSPLDVPGPTRVRHVDLATPGDGPNDQPATRRRVEALRRWPPPARAPRGRPRTRGGAQSRVVGPSRIRGTEGCWNRWETLCAGGGAELIRDAVRPALRELIEAQAAGVTAARRYERSYRR